MTVDRQNQGVDRRNSGNFIGKGYHFFHTIGFLISNPVPLTDKLTDVTADTR